MPQIEAEELDDIAREGLADLRASLRPGANKGTVERGMNALKIVGHSTKRMNAQNAERLADLRTAKAIGLSPDSQSFLWEDVKRRYRARGIVVDVTAQVESAG